jgi:hypothetical protein
MYWMRAQKGLFYSVMQFLRDEKYGGKLHIIISIRDHVYSSILQSEHESRYPKDQNYITVLKWDSKSSIFLLEQKIKYLEEKYFLLDKNKDAYNWVGIEHINNNVRNINELFINYLIRHTRAIPRDIVSIGNDICNFIVIAKEKRLDKHKIELTIKEIISDNAIKFADEQLTITSNHLTSNLMPSQAVELGIDKMYTSVYTGDNEYLNLSGQYKDKIIEIIKIINKDRFKFSDIKKAQKQAIKIFQTDTDLNVFDILWQNNLIGYSCDEDHAIFYDEESTDFTLPTNKENYVFHSILIDKLALTPIGKPVNIKYTKCI